MTDNKEIIENLKDTLKNSKKQHIKNNKNKFSSKKEKLPKIIINKKEKEFTEIENGKNGLNYEKKIMDTSFLKNLNKLFSNDEDINKDNKHINGKVITKRNTIIKFNKTPKNFGIEKFTLAEKTIKKRNTLVDDKKDDNKIEIKVRKKSKQKNDKYDKQNEVKNKIKLNNMDESKENILDKDKYESDEEDNNNFYKKNSKLNSNIISNSKKLNKEIKEHKIKNTAFVKLSDLDNVLNIDINEKDKHKEKEKSKRIEKNKKEEKSKRKAKTKREGINKKEENENSKENSKHEENIKIEEKEEKDYNEKKGNNLSPIRKIDKNVSRKHSRVSFHISNNKKKSINKKSSEKYLCIDNIPKNDISRKTENDDISNYDENKKINKNIMKSSNKIDRRSLNNFHFDFDKDLKTKKYKQKKSIKFQSVLNPNKNNLFDTKASQISPNKKKFKNNKVKTIDEYKMNSSSNDFDKKENNKEKIKKSKIINNIIAYKNESNKINQNCLNTHENSLINNSIKLKDNNEFKNNIQSISQYKMKHVNNIYVGSNLYKNNRNNSLIKIPSFSVVKPDKLISFEYNRAYENNNRTYLLSKIAEDMFNNDNIKEKTYKYKNDGNNDNKIEKKNKSFFCCL